MMLVPILKIVFSLVVVVVVTTFPSANRKNNTEYATVNNEYKNPRPVTNKTLAT